MSKKLNEAALENELSGSAFFQDNSRHAAGPSHEDSVADAPSAPAPDQSVVRPDARTPGSPPVQSPVREPARTPVRRSISRYAFEFYLDQIARLRDISLQEKLQGLPGSMSEMVREAVDAYLARREEEDGRAPDRTG